LQRRAAERATRLLIEMAGGQPGPIIEAVAPDHLPVQLTIRLRPERIRKLLGMDVSGAEIENILRRLGMTVTAETDGWLVTPPAAASMSAWKPI
jgi:phenylalanyl-tRNA synthetase beta chain